MSRFGALPPPALRGRRFVWMLPAALAAVLAVSSGAHAGGGGPSLPSPPSRPSPPVTNPRPSPPVFAVDAGADQTVEEGDAVTLSGTSAASGGSWSQTGGATVSLSSTTSRSPTFTAPQVASDETLTFRFSVSKSWSWCRRNASSGGSCVDRVSETTTRSDTVRVAVEDVPPLEAGRLPGTLSVSSEGAAAYSVPIEVPPGTAGVEPSLGLSYSSSGGDGLLGLGWALDGFSEIARCAKTQAQDGERGAVTYGSSDRFCLDGQRLVAVKGAYGASGTEYRTELETFAKVVSRGTAGSGPSYFEVRTKDGRRLEYGRTADSRVEASGISTVRQWLVNRVEDTVGNYYAVRYAEEGGRAYPDRIDYTGHGRGASAQAPHSSVRFSYEARGDARAWHRGGREIRLSKRLTHIRAYAGSSLVSEYRVSYLPSSPSRVSEVARCDGSGACQPGTEFAWNAFGTGVQPSAAVTVTVAQARGEDDSGLVGDADGDGRDLDVVPPDQGVRYKEKHLGDFNGDGLADLAYVDPSSVYYDKKKGRDVRTAGLHVRVLLSDGTGDFSAAEAVDSEPYGTGDFSKYVSTLGDFNGDGLADLAWSRAFNGGIRAYVSLGDGTGALGRGKYALMKRDGDYSAYRPVAGDFNGDGLTDLAWSAGHSGGGIRAYVSLSGGASGMQAVIYSKVLSSGSFAGYAVSPGDFNGDGIADLAWTRAYSGGIRAQVSLGDGAGGLKPATASVIRSSGSYANHHAGTRVGDFNGDGISDIAWTHALDSQIAFGDGAGGFRPAVRSAIKTPQHPKGGRVRTGDFDGDGITDLMWPRSRTVKDAQTGKDRVEHMFYQSLMGAASPAPGRISSISSEAGSTLTLEYAPLTDSTVYAKDAGADRCSRPCVDIQAPLHVVKRVVRDHGQKLTHRTEYRYGGAKADTNGRGFKGFRWMEAHDREAGIKSRTAYEQDFPYAGRVASSVSRLASSATTKVGEQSNTWSAKSLNGGKTRFAYVSSGTAKTYEASDGAGNKPVATVKTMAAYDAYGNATSLVVETKGAGGTFRKTTASAYSNDASKWHLGRLTCASVLHEAPGATAQTRKSGFAYSAATGLLAKEVVEPRASDVPGCASSHAGKGTTLVKSYAHDKYGNRTTTTVGGPGLASRATTVSWGELDASGTLTANGRFPAKTENALGHAEHRWHSKKHGGAVRLKGPNGLATRWEYDGFGRTTLERRADGTQTSTSYARCALKTVSCPAGATLRVAVQATGAPTAKSYLDRRGLAIRSETQGFDGTAVYRDAEHDALGRTKRESRPYFSTAAASAVKWTSYAYDAVGRVKTETRPDGSRTERLYDGLVTLSGGGKRLQERARVFAPGVTEASKARTESRQANALGWRTRATDAAGSSTSYAHDALGNVVQTTDAANNRITATYDIRGRKTGLSDPDMGKWTYTHDALGNLLTQTDAKKQTATYAYDKLGRVKTRTESEGTTTWSYDSAAKGKGKLWKVSGPGGYSRTHAYDSAGRPKSESEVIGQKTFATSRSYDAQGRVSVLTYPKTGFAVRHGYTASGYLKSLKDASSSSAKAHWTATAVDAEGRVTAESFGNGVNAARTYEAATGRLTRIRSGLGKASGVQDLGYSYDGHGNLSKREDYGQNVYENFGYDALGRLTSSSVHAAGTKAKLAGKTYAYDAVGNLKKKSDAGAADYVYGTGNASGPGDAGPHAVVSAGGRSYAYDDNGNMVSGAGRTLSWYSYNKPKQVADAASTVTFEYGPERSRTRQIRVQGAKTTTITYVGGIFEQMAATGEAPKSVHYLFAGGRRVAVYAKGATSSSSKTRYLHQDHLGSVDAVTDEQGAVAERLSYGAFGKRRTASGSGVWRDSAAALSGSETARGFTGHEHLDALALVHMNGRVYDPHLGRFLSADPFVQRLSPTQGLNRYSYAYNNPLSYVDPSGYFFKKVFRKILRPVKKVLGNVLELAKSRAGRLMAAVVFAVHGGPAVSSFFNVSGNAAAGSFITHFGTTLIASGGDLRAAFSSGVRGAAGAAFGHAGQTFGGSDLAARTMLNSALDGSREAPSGGRSGPGLSGTASSQPLAPAASGDAAFNTAGGKFANGSTTEAFAYLDNMARGPHRYIVATKICVLSENCTLENVAHIAMRRPAPGVTLDEPIGNGQISEVELPGMSLGKVKHEIYYQDEHGVAFGNVALSGHRLYPGTVGRYIYRSDGAIWIKTHGWGSGLLPWLNEFLAGYVWPSIDNEIREGIQ